MFRQAPPLLARSMMARSRAFSDVPAQPASDSAFVEAWKKVIPNIDPPQTPLSFMQPRPTTPSSIPSKITVNFVLPYQSELSAKEVDMVIIPATTGQMGVLPGHVTTIAELKPGIMSVHEGSEVTKYFVSSGFAFIHANSVADVVAVEAVPVDRIDPSLVQKGLAEFTQKLSSASTDLEKAEAQIGVDVHSALNSAITGYCPQRELKTCWSKLLKADALGGSMRGYSEIHVFMSNRSNEVGPHHKLHRHLEVSSPINTEI